MNIQVEFILGTFNFNDEELQTIERDFISNFMNNLSQLSAGQTNIEGAIQNSVIKTFHKKPTENFDKTYRKVKECDIGKTCNICMDEFKENEFKRDLNCNHTFHKKCIDKMINKYHNYSCPLCRKHVFS